MSKCRFLLYTYEKNKRVYIIIKEREYDVLTLRRARIIQIFYTLASANSLIWTQETISLVQKMPITAFAVSGLAFFCSGVFYKMTKEDRIIEMMTETHERHLEQLEERMERFVESREVEFSNAEHEKSRVKIRKRIERYLDWYEGKVRQVEDSFQDRLERRLKNRRENMRN